MKTPQEQAQELVFDLKLNSWSKTHIIESIPLAELIAVAQAAVTMQDILENEFDYRPDEEPAGVYQKCKDAIEALRATNKIEL